MAPGPFATLGLHSRNLSLLPTLASYRPPVGSSPQRRLDGLSRLRCAAQTFEESKVEDEQQPQQEQPVAASSTPTPVVSSTADEGSSSSVRQEDSAGSGGRAYNGRSGNGGGRGRGRGGYVQQQRGQQQNRAGRGRGEAVPRWKPPLKPTPSQVIAHFERLEGQAHEDFGQRRVVNKRQLLDRRRLQRSEEFAMGLLESFAVEDALELFQILSELEFSVDQSLFPKLMPQLTDWLHARKDNIEDSTSTWAQVLWLHRLSPTLQQKRGPLLDACLSYLSQEVDSIGPQEVHTVVLSAAYLRLPATHAEFVDQTLARASQLHKQEGSGMCDHVDELSDIVWSIGRMGYTDGMWLFEELLPTLTARVNEMQPKFAANVAWAAASLGLRCTAYHDALSQRILLSPPAQVPKADASDAEIQAELAAMQAKDEAGSRDGGSEKSQPPSRGVFRAKQLSNVVWGWAKCGYKPSQEVLQRVVELSLQQERYFAPQDWDSLLWGYIKLGQSVPKELLQAAGGGVLRVRRWVQGRTLGGIIKSYGQCGYTTGKYLPQLLELLSSRLDRMTAYDLSNVMVGLGHLAGAFGAANRTANSGRRASPMAAPVAPATPAATEVEASEASASAATSEQGSTQQQAQPDAPTDMAAAAVDSEPSTLLPVPWRTGGGSTFCAGPASVPYLDPELLPKLEQKALALFESAAPQGLANITWGFAKLNYRSTALLEASVQQAKARLFDLSARDCIDLLWSWARLEYRPDPFVIMDVTNQLARRTGSTSSFVWGPREFAVTLWSLGTIEQQPSALLMTAIRRVLPDVMPGSTPMDLANILWGLARLEYNLPRPVFVELLNRVTDALPEAEPGEMSTILLSLARMERYPGDATMEAVAQRTIASIDQFSPKALVHIVSAFAKFQYCHQQLNMEVCKKAIATARRRQATSSTAGSSSRYEGEAASSAAEDAASPSTSAGSEAASSTGRDTGSSSSGSGMPAAFYGAPHLELLDWAALLTAFGRVAFNPGPELLDVLVDELDALPVEGSAKLEPTLVASAMWLVALFDEFPSRLYSRCLEAVDRMTAGDLGDPAAVRMLYQSHLLAVATGRATAGDLPPEVRAHLSGTVDAIPGGIPDSDSRLLVDIAATLGRLSIKHQTGVPAKHRMFAVDIVLDRANEQVCIEALERSDVSRNGQALLGPTLYRKRLLEAYGWKVISLGFWEWEELGFDNDAKENYMLAMARNNNWA